MNLSSVFKMVILSSEIGSVVTIIIFIIILFTLVVLTIYVPICKIIESQNRVSRWNK